MFAFCQSTAGNSTSGSQDPVSSGVGGDASTDSKRLSCLKLFVCFLKKKHIYKKTHKSWGTLSLSCISVASVWTWLFFDLPFLRFWKLAWMNVEDVSTVKWENSASLMSSSKWFHLRYLLFCAVIPVWLQLFVLWHKSCRSVITTRRCRCRNFTHIQWFPMLQTQSCEPFSSLSCYSI